MKVSDYIVKFFIQKGIKHIFGYPGGMVTDIMESLDKNKDKIGSHISYHEQGASFATCGMAQITHEPGVCYATSGPGATNLITGISNCYFDSIPCIFITGQVNTNEVRNNTKSRQIGFQETDIISIVKPITKYAKKIEDISEIKIELEKSYYICKNKRPGPVLLDIPINIQKSDIEIDEESDFIQPEEIRISTREIDRIHEELKKSRRPVIIAGNGINISNCSSEFRELIEKWQIPVVTSMIAVDCVPSDSEYNYGFLGVYGHRYANIIVERSDCIIAMGTRLDVRQTGPREMFARNSKLIRIDIDSEELTNIIKEDEIQINGDLKEIIKQLLKENNNIEYKEWNTECQNIRKELETFDKKDYVSIIKKLNDIVPEDSILTTDVGQNQVWISQYWKTNPKQRILFSGRTWGYGVLLTLCYWSISCGFQ